MNVILKEVATLQGHNQQVTCIDVPEEGNSQTFFTSSRDKKILQWKLLNDESLAICQKSYEESKNYVHSIVSTEKKVLSGGADGMGRIYDIKTKESIPLKGHTRDITCVTVNSFDNKIVTGSIDGSFCLWNSRGELKSKFEKNHPGMHQDWINCASFIPNKDQLVTGSSDGTLKVWDINTGEVLKTFYKGSLEVANDLGKISALSITPDGQICAYGGWDSTVYFNDLEKGTLIGKFPTESAITCLAFAWNEPIIAVGAKTHVYLWDVVSGRVLNTIKCGDFGNKTFCTSLGWSKNILMIGLSTGAIKAYEYSRETQ